MRSKTMDCTVAFMALGFAQAWGDGSRWDMPQIEAMLETIEHAKVADRAECGDCHAYNLAEPFGAAIAELILQGEIVNTTRAKAVLRDIHTHDCGMR